VEVYEIYGQVHDPGNDSGEVCIKTENRYLYLGQMLDQAGIDTDDYVEIVIRSAPKPIDG